MLEIPEVLAQVAVPLPIPTVFTYVIPEPLLARAIPGVRATVPFRNTEITGYIVAVEPFSTSAAEMGSKAVKMKPLISILDEEPVLSAGMLQLTKRVSEHYGSSWGEAIENALPRWVKYGKKDHKVSKWQTAAYAYAWEKLTRKKVSERASVLLRPDGTYQREEHKNPLKRDFDDFVTILRCVILLTNNKLGRK